MARVFYSQKTDQIIKKLELTPETRILNHDISIAVKNGDIYTLIKIIKKKLTSVWRN